MPYLYIVSNKRLLRKPKTEWIFNEAKHETNHRKVITDLRPRAVIIKMYEVGAEIK